MRSRSLGPLPALLFRRHRDAGPRVARTRSSRSPTTSTLYRVFDALTSAIAVGLVGYVLYVLVGRWQRATQPQRRAMAPILWSGIALLVLLAGSLTLRGGRRSRRRRQRR